VGFVFEVYQPLFSYTVNLNRNHDAAGIDLIGDLQVFQLALCTQLLHGKQRQIHEADKFVTTAFVENLTVCQIVFVGSLNRSLVLSVGNSHIL